MSGAYKKEKKELLDKLDELDKKAEISLLNQTELNLKHVLNERLAEWLNCYVKRKLNGTKGQR